MRVTLISHNARAGDAIGNQVAARAAFFRDHGAEVRVLVESDRYLHLELHRSTRVVSHADFPGLVGELRQDDLLIVEYGQFYSLLELLPQVAGKGPRILIDYHGVTPPHLWDGPAEALRQGRWHRGMVWYADQAVVHSDFMRRELCAATGYPAERVHKLPLWFNSARIATNALQSRLRQKLQLADERILLFVGRLAANKRVPVLIEALALLKNDKPAVHAVIIGDHGDRYRRQLDQCRDTMIRHQLSERVHILGHVSEDELIDAYQSADVFVMPSLHEGCCIPVLEAMAAGLPVIAARSSALPETIAGAGLTFAPDDPSDLSNQIRRVLSNGAAVESAPESGRRIAVIAPKYGEDVLGGAERSLRLMAETLASAGYCVEVFTTGKSDESINGVRVHRYPLDLVDDRALSAATQARRRSESISDEALTQYLAQTRFSQRLIAEYAARADQFEACIVGPYGNGLTCEVVRIRPERTLLVPCFHREALAAHAKLATFFGQVGGLLFHSDAERRFAERELGISHPNSIVIGTWISDVHSDSRRGCSLVGPDRPYLLYAGRFCQEKNLPLLLEWQQAYAAERPNRYRFAFVGGGSARMPRGDDWRNLGFLSEADKSDVMAGAAAVVQLSTNESLSLAVLEAWRVGVPVVGHADCDSVREMIEACGGGFAVATYEQFRDALNELWANDVMRRELGERGKNFVAKHFESRELFKNRLTEVLEGLRQPLAKLMRARGRSLMANRTVEAWGRAFAARVDAVLHAEPLESRIAATIAPRKGEQLRVRRGARRAGVRLSNIGTTPLWPDGLHATRLRCRIRQSGSDRDAVTRLPRPLGPGESIVFSARIPPIDEPGEFHACFALATSDAEITIGEVPMQVIDLQPKDSGMPDDMSLAEIGAQLAAVESLAELPASYVDISEGLLARWKQAVKRKLLHQFQVGYVDLLSRQQTAFNQQMLAVVQELMERFAMLSPATDPSTEMLRAVRRLNRRVVRMSRRMDELEQRLKALEAAEGNRIEN